jgi:hypothetical protein
VNCPEVKVVWQPSWTQINASSFPGNIGGLEDGIVVRRNDGHLSMIAAEMSALSFSPLFPAAGFASLLRVLRLLLDMVQTNETAQKKRPSSTSRATCLAQTTQ